MSFATAAPAQESGVDEARERFMEGVELYQSGEYEAALADFTRAYELAPHYALFYNIGLVHARLQNYPAAVEALERYLGEGGDEIQPRRQADVRRELNRMRRRVGRLEVELHGPDQARLIIDGTEVATLPQDGDIPVSQGRPVIEVRSEGFLPWRRDVNVAGGVTTNITVSMDRISGHMGAVVVSSLVPGVDILLDGTRVGMTPLDTPIVAEPGQHVVEAAREGYETSGRTVNVTVGEITNVSINVAPMAAVPTNIAGYVEVEASEDDAEALLDGAPLPEGPIPMGPHVLEVRRQGFHSYYQEFDLERGRTQRFEAMLRPTEGYLERYVRRARLRRMGAGILIGVGAAILAVDLAMLVYNIGRDEEYQAEFADLSARNLYASDEDLLDSYDQNGDGTCCDLEDYEIFDSRVDANDLLGVSLEKWNIAMWVMLGAGAGAVVAGVVLFALSPSPRRYTRMFAGPTASGWTFGLVRQF